MTLLLSSRHVKLYSINSHSKEDKTLLLLFGQSNDIGASLDLACTPIRQQELLSSTFPEDEAGISFWIFSGFCFFCRMCLIGRSSSIIDVRSVDRVSEGVMIIHSS